MRAMSYCAKSVVDFGNRVDHFVNRTKSIFNLFVHKLYDYTNDVFDMEIRYNLYYCNV